MLTPHHIGRGSGDLLAEAFRPWILSLADDLTGALEVGAKFAAHGVSAIVTTNRQISARPECDVLVIDTETRHLSQDQAFETVRRTLVAASRLNPATVYKKTDSTLRGNIAAELRALQSVFPERELIYAPAYVAMGRTVRNGHLYIAGKLIHETEFAHDPLNPVRESNIRAMLNNDTISVLDAESHDEADRAVRLIMEGNPTPLSAGPAALAEAIALHLQAESALPGPLPRVPRCLVINGSLHANSREQIAFAHAKNAFRDGWVFFNQEFQAAGLDRAKQVGECVRTTLSSSTFDALIVFGGDTAFAIHHALNAPDFTSLGEVLPGIPVALSGGLVWITKAGGFGPPDVLNQIRKQLAEAPAKTE